MSEQVAYLELRYGKIKELDVHGLTLEEAKAEIVHCFTLLDVNDKGLLITHGYHRGRVLKNYIRNDLKHKNILKKINVDASRTLLLVDMEK